MPKPRVSAEPKPLTQYHHEVWQTQDGLPTNGIRALAQTRDGYIWIGTEAGLVRFDGVAFTAFDRNSDPVLRGTNVTALYEDRSGALSIGTDEGSVIRARAGGFEDIATNRLRGAVTAFHEDRAGTLWVAGGDEVARLEDQQLVTVSGAPGNVAVLFEGDAGSLRVGTNGPEGRLDGDRILPVSPGLEDVQAAWRETDGVLWLGLRNGLLRVGSGIRLFTVRDGLPANSVTSIIADRADGIWVGTRPGSRT